MIRTQVIVAGAGPVGTVAAYMLALRGVDVVVLEANDSCEEDMRASTFHSPTIALLDQLGIADRLIQTGLKAPLFQYRIRTTQEVLEFNLAELDDVLEFPFRLQCEQYKLARLLAAELHTQSTAEVHFNNRVTSFEQDESGVTVTTESADGPRTYHGSYLIAADGAKSSIRRQLGVEFPGFTYRENFLTLSTDTDISTYFDDLCYVNYVSDPDEWFVLLKVPTAWRILVPIGPGESDEYAVSDARKNALFEGLIGTNASITTNHRTIYRVHQRVADKMNHSRVLLAGDSAHLNNPLGGFGMNGGIHDAWNLGEKLTLILKEGAKADELLARYDRQRRTIMHEFVQAQTIRNKKMIEESGEDSRRREWDEMRQIHQNEDRRRAYMLRQSMAQSLRDEARIQ